MNNRIRFTANRISIFSCPTTKAQAFLWDSSNPGLGLRVTPNGKPCFVFQSRLAGKSIRITIGSPKIWSITDAQAKAREYQRQLDEGYDPRQLRKELRARQEIKKKEETLKLFTFGEVFREYFEDRKQGWGERHYLDQVSMISKGKKGRTGVLWPLVNLKLCDIDSEIIEELMRREGARRQARARLALRHLRAFFTWASEHKRWCNVAERSCVQ